MDYNERAKKSPFNIDEDIDILKENTKQTCELRKKHNHNIIMAERRKRVISGDEIKDKQKNEIIKNENIFTDNILNDDLYLLDESNEYKIYLFYPDDLQLKLRPLNSISNNIKMILEFLTSDNIENIKWVIYALRRYFEVNEIEEYTEYSILFENNIHQHLEKIINKYRDNYYIINEILFFVSNLFGNIRIVNQYPEKYFQYFLTDNYFKVYEDINILQEEDLVNSILILLKNLIFEQHELINDIIYKRRNFIYNILIFFKEKNFYHINTVKSFISFFSIIMKELQGSYIKQIEIINLIIDIFVNIYKKLNAIEMTNIIIVYIKQILGIFKNLLSCKVRNRDDNDDYFVLNYLFSNTNKNTTSFVKSFCEILLKKSNIYFNNISLLLSCLNLLFDITYNATSFQIENILNYQIFDILNSVFYFKNSYDNEINYIIKKLLTILDNIINSGLDFSLILIKTKFFENMISFFAQNIGNIQIVDSFLDTFIFLLSYEDKNIGDNLNKRGIIKDGVLNSLLYPNSNANKNIVLKECKVISLYLKSLIDINNYKNGYNKEDFCLCCKYKEILLSGQLNIPEGAIESIIKSDYMQIADNI